MENLPPDPMINHPWLIAGFAIAVVIMLLLDLGVFNKKSHTITNKEALGWSILWISFSMIFSAVVYFVLDKPQGITDNFSKYQAAYWIEKALSVDNLFVFILVFKFFKIPKYYQHKVLFWGILGAVIFRGLMIYFGVILINKFSWMTYIFGLFLLFTAAKMLFKGDNDEAFNPKKSFIYKLIGKVIPITSQMDGEHFFVKRRHITAATPLFVALLVIEFMDMVFALDSVPAILAITSDPFLVFSSNIFAILGLRSMYFFLANMLEKFSYLEYSLIVILTFVGIKMFIVHYYKFPEWVSLSVIALSLASGVVYSLFKNK